MKYFPRNKYTPLKINALPSEHCPSKMKYQAHELEPVQLYLCKSDFPHGYENGLLCTVKFYTPTTNHHVFIKLNSLGPKQTGSPCSQSQ